MNFDLTEDQRALADAVASLCRKSCSVESLAAAEGVGMDHELWSALADMGVFGLRSDPDDGFGLPDAAVVFEQLGRVCTPGPLVATHLAAVHVAGAVSGAEPVTAVARGSEPLVVEHPHESVHVAVVADDEIRLVEAASLRGRAVRRPLDPLTPCVVVDGFDDGVPLGGREAAQAWIWDGTVLTAAFLVGVAEAMLDTTTEFVRDRRQFHRPIGSFQAVKHRLADCLVRLDVARAAVYAAAVLLGEDRNDGSRRAARVAKLLAGEAAIENAAAAVQLHGAMGFTWELDVHYFAKRAWLLDTHYGSVHDHAVALAS